MYKPLRYTPPFRLLGRELTRPILEGSRSEVLRIYRGFVARMQPGPLYEGLENLPDRPRFVLAANHYQRKGLWIAHAAAAIGAALIDRYGCDPPIRWIVTSNWPHLRIGRLSMPSPGDVILPRVAHALWCYAVPFAGSDPLAAGASLRRLVKESDTIGCPIGVFPEGAKAIAGELRPPLPGVGRFLTVMARRAWPVLPVGVSECGRFSVRFGQLVSPEDVCRANDAGEMIMSRIGTVLRQPSD